MCCEMDVASAPGLWLIATLSGFPWLEPQWMSVVQWAPHVFWAIRELLLSLMQWSDVAQSSFIISYETGSYPSAVTSTRCLLCPNKAHGPGATTWLWSLFILSNWYWVERLACKREAKVYINHFRSALWSCDRTFSSHHGDCAIAFSFWE